MKLLVTGGGGQLADAIGRRSDARVFGREGLDITNEQSITEAFRIAKPDIVINAAARIQDDTSSEMSLGLHDGLGEHHRSRTKRSRSRDPGSRVNEPRSLISEGAKLIQPVQALSSITDAHQSCVEILEHGGL